ncbi:MAG: RNA polymerase sigma factor [Fuerstiella sp.]
MAPKIKAATQKQIFTEWTHQHRGLLFKLVRAYAFNATDRDDLFQEISIQLYNSIPKYRGDSSAPTWIYRVALYAAIAWSKRERKHSRKEHLAGDEHTLIQANQAQDPRLDWLYDQVARLNEIDRSLTLLLLDGFSYLEMADILGISESNVGVKIHRIKQHLTQIAKDNHGI